MPSSTERGIRVALTRGEYAALSRCVSGELESLTEADWESGMAEDLHAAQVALIKAWKRWQKRHA
jgi:hypothetical protein